MISVTDVRGAFDKGCRTVSCFFFCVYFLWSLVHLFSFFFIFSYFFFSLNNTSLDGGQTVFFFSTLEMVNALLSLHLFFFSLGSSRSKTVSFTLAVALALVVVVADLA